jgi:ABC-type hemin transport system substrate-binding protein
VFEGVLTKLTQQIISHFEVRPEDVFLSFNYQDSNNEEFDDFFLNKRDLGKVLRETAKLVGCPQMAAMLMARLSQNIQKAQMDPENLQAWI